MPNSVLPNTQLSIPSLSPPYTLQPSSTFGTSAEALTKSLESDFIEINPSAFANESSITTVEPSSSLISTTFEIQTSESSVNVMTTTDTSCMSSVTSTCETSLKLSPSLSPSSTQDIEMSSTLMQGEPVVTFPGQIVEDRLLSKRITCSVDAGIPVSMVTWSVEFQDGRKIENFNFNPTEETNSNNHVSSFFSTFNIS
ncbi:hypothetical protein SNE40_001151 [Patella caerulea]|uniref:Ig-like domain-containing protein n=1 Tax=Patella caerulea TaxID=87958 RepID=A0AAN8K6L1_PATCE